MDPAKQQEQLNKLEEFLNNPLYKRLEQRAKAEQKRVLDAVMFQPVIDLATFLIREQSIGQASVFSTVLDELQTEYQELKENAANNEP